MAHILAYLQGYWQELTSWSFMFNLLMNIRDGKRLSSYEQLSCLSGFKLLAPGYLHIHPHYAPGP